MLDKKIPYKDLVMAARPGERPQPAPKVPQGFVLRGFQPGDEKAWAEIETSVLEFDDTQKALDYFKKEYGPHPQELSRRCFFLFTAQGEPVATASAWFDEIDGESYPKVHWVAVVPAYQGRGFGKLLMEQVMAAFYQLAPGQRVFLHTQTWSHKAVWLYRQLGFSLVKDQPLFIENDIPGFYRQKHNAYTAALPILYDALGQERARALEEEAV